MERAVTDADRQVTLQNNKLITFMVNKQLVLISVKGKGLNAY